MSDEEFKLNVMNDVFDLINKVNTYNYDAYFIIYAGRIGQLRVDNGISPLTGVDNSDDFANVYKMNTYFLADYNPEFATKQLADDLTGAYEASPFGLRYIFDDKK